MPKMTVPSMPKPNIIPVTESEAPSMPMMGKSPSSSLPTSITTLSTEPCTVSGSPSAGPMDAVLTEAENLMVKSFGSVLMSGHCKPMVVIWMGTQLGHFRALGWAVFRLSVTWKFSRALKLPSARIWKWPPVPRIPRVIRFTETMPMSAIGSVPSAEASIVRSPTANSSVGLRMTLTSVAESVKAPFLPSEKSNVTERSVALAVNLLLPGKSVKSATARVIEPVKGAGSAKSTSTSVMVSDGSVTAAMVPML